MRVRSWQLILVVAALFFAPSAHAAPTITTLSVSLGPVGTAVTITGTNFGTTQGTSTVKFNGTTASVTSWSGTSIQVTVPSAATTGNVVVTVSNVASNGKPFTVTPKITSLSITSGVVGAAVTITGTTFGSPQGTSTVKFNGTTGTVTSWGVSSIAVTVPSGATTGNVVVTVSSQASNGVNFTVAPAITSLSITSGAVGAAVTITGTTFGSTQGTSTVTFNGTAAAITTWGASSIAVTVPAGATTGNVVVTVSSQASNGVNFTVVPAITSLSATSGAVGAAVTITGTTFGSTQGTSTVKFNGTAASVTSWGASSIAVTVPSAATTGNVVVTVNGVSSGGFAFTVLPGITSLSPTTGAVGASITITGTNFGSTQGSSTVKFNGTATTPTSWSSISIGVPVPSGATTGNVVVTVAGLASSGVNFTVVPAPTISNLSVTSGVVGTPVTITGTNFGAAQGTSTVTFNGTDAPPTSWSATSIVVPVPSEATTGNVVVNAGGVASNGINFTVTETLGIANLSPTSGVVGSEVAITGIGFGATQGTSTISLNGTTVPVASWSDSSILATVPVGASSGPFSLIVNGHAVNSPTFTITTLPAGWLDGDVGSVGLSGSASFANGTFTVAGAGLGLASTADGLHFVYQSLSGDGTIVARVASLQGSSTQAGVMIRETLTAGATVGAEIYNHYFSYLMFYDRPTTGASIAAQNGVYSLTLPYWVKLVRSGSTFTGYASPDGVNWVQSGTSATVSMAQNVYIGLMVSSTSSGTLATATFDGVSVSSTTTPAPAITSVSATTGSIGSQVSIIGTSFGASQGGSVVILNGAPMTVNSWTSTSIVATIPVGATSGPMLVSVAPSMNDSNPVSFTVTTQPLPATWLDQDVGTVGAVGSAGFTNGVFTVSGAGSGLNGTADQVQYVYLPLSGDGAIVARLVSLQGSVAQAGIMIRETLDPAASSVSELLSRSSAYLMTYSRPTLGGTLSSQYDVYSPTLPYWMKLVRSGSTFNAYGSTDGVNWVQAGTSMTVSMAQNVYIGLMVSSTQSATLATGTFDSVSISSTTTPAPAITSISATTGSVGGQVLIGGTGFGASQNGSFVMLNNVPMTVNLWTSTSIIATIPTGATSGPLLVSVAPSMNDSNVVDFTVTTQPLPTPWLDQDVGTVGALGSASYTSGVFTVSGAGSGLSGSPDQFQYVYLPLSGDGAIVARLASLVGSYAQAGIMIRETLDPAARSASELLNRSAVYLMTYNRPTPGGTLSSQYDVYGPALPYWMKLVRSGSTFNAYGSTDGVNWIQAGTSMTVSMAQNVYIGLMVSSTQSTTLATGTFDNVSITVGTTPFVTGVSPNLGGTGTSVTITGSNFGSPQGTSTVKFNGTLAASVTSWTNTQIVAVVASSTPVGTGPVTVTVNSITSPTNVTFTMIKPVITSITPPAAEIGGTVTLTGTGFGTSQGTVQFNSISAGITSWSDTSITVFVPAGATSGLVTVTEDGITSTGVSFAVLGTLSVTGISPNVGPVGSTITITGAGFGSTQSNSTASLYGAIATSIVSWSDSQIVAVVPAGAASGQVSVQVAGITAYGPSFTLNSTVQLTDSLGHFSAYTSQLIGGIWVPSNSQGSGCSSCSLRGAISYTYDNQGNVLTRTDELGRITYYSYDTNNNVTSVSSPISPGIYATTTYTYNSFSEVLTTTDPMGKVTTNTYDSQGNLLTVTTPAPNGSTAASVTTFTYDTKGELLTIKDPLNNVTTLTYYPTGLINTVKDAQNNVTTYVYDPHGNRMSVTDAAQNQTTFAYDSGDRLKTITYPGSTGTTTFNYDNRGRRTSVTDQNGKTTTYGYDDADRLTSVTDAATPANVTTYGYDTENNLTSIQDANGHATSFFYDAFGRVIQTTFPSGVETYEYDEVGNLKHKTDRKNQLITYTYDQLNRLIQKAYPDTTTVNYTYDNDSRLTQVTDPTGTYQFTFDNMGRLTSTTTSYAFLAGRNFTTSYGYDAASNRTGFTDPESGATSYAYDTLNRLQTLTPPSAFSGTGNFGFTYDALSRRTQMTRPNGLKSVYAYDNLSRLQSVLHQSGATTIDGAAYTVDNAGNRTSRTPQPSGTASNYTYDNIYQLTGVTQSSTTTESYTYDPVGNRLSSLGVSPYVNNTSNQLTSIPGTTYTYDNNGNTLTKAVGSNTTSYTWDFENRLTSVTLPGTGGTVQFSYDPFGRRIKKVSSTGTSVFAYDGDNLIEETNATGAVVARYSQGQNVDEPLAVLRSATTSYFEADGLDSVSSLSNAAGALAQTYTFDSFGNQTASSGSLTNSFRYAGREFDTETGLYYMRARYFDPATGRFLSEDPTGFDGDAVDFYGYAGENPTNFIDPFGEQQGAGTATAPAPPTTNPPSAPPVKAPPRPIPDPPLPTPTPGPGWWPGLGAILSRGGILAGLQLTIFAPSTARDEDLLPKPHDKTPPCDNKNEPDCKKADQFHLDGAGISDPHEFKREHLGRKAPISRYDICACKDGSIVIKPRGQCGSPGPGIDTGHTWK